jgi:hypothetical protein
MGIAAITAGRTPNRTNLFISRGYRGADSTMHRALFVDPGASGGPRDVSSVARGGGVTRVKL